MKHVIHISLISKSNFLTAEDIIFPLYIHTWVITSVPSHPETSFFNSKYLIMINRKINVNVLIQL